MADTFLWQDRFFMERALTLARQALGRTHPNPPVGAVVVQGEHIIGVGFTQPGGRPHAEAGALEAAGRAARGATLYVTLEPCSHTHNRDGSPRLSCARRCIEAGIARVVCATGDPDARVAGQGFQLLRDADIDVAVGLDADAARAVDPAYFYHRVTGLPYVTHKAAMTLDGKIAATGGHSRWVTGDVARAYVHEMRDVADAIVVGVGTVLSDDPSLTTRLSDAQIQRRGRNGQDPFRVIIDSTLRTPPTAKVARPGTVFLTTARATESARTRLMYTGAEVVTLAADADTRVSVTDVVRWLGERDVLSVLLESGGALAASFYQARRVQQAMYIIAPKIIGGAEAPTPVDGTGVSRDMGEALGLDAVDSFRLGNDIVIAGTVIYNETPMP